jgi:hypothetical protein
MVEIADPLAVLERVSAFGRCLFFVQCFSKGETRLAGYEVLAGVGLDF